MKFYIKYIYALLILVLCLVSCQNEELVRSGSNNSFHVSADFIKLTDDSTNIAGNLVISAKSSQVQLRWNVPDGCNLDTTLTVLSVSKGKANLPIKWDKALETGTYGPLHSSYEAGVLVSTEEESRYVRLFWVEKLDTTEVLKSQVIMTKANDIMPKTPSVELLPDDNVTMNQETGGGVYVLFSGTPVISIDATKLTSETNVDQSSIPLMMEESGQVLFKWTNAGAPNFNVVRTVRFSASRTIYQDAKINYTVPGNDAVYEFISCSPNKNGVLPAQNATVTVVIRTNKEWSLVSDLNKYPPTEDSNAFGPEEKNLTMSVMDNPGRESREVKIIVKSQAINKDTLTFIQLGNTEAGIFDFLGSTPADQSNIPGTASTVDVTVKTDMAWYIRCGCSVPDRMDFDASTLSTQTKTFSIPANDRNEGRLVTLEVGTRTSTGESVLKKTLTFLQAPYSGEEEETLNYESSNLPAGNIPVAGNTYTFIFSGTFTGGVQVRALVNGVAQTEGTSVTNKQPQCTVPTNVSTSTRNIAFEYKREDGEWTTLPASTNRIQDANNGGGTGENIVANTVLPTGDLSEYGQSCYCTFTGGPGKVIFRARKNGNINAIAQSEEYDVTPSTSATLAVNIPALQNEKDAVITFEYSTDGGNTWELIATKKQVNESIGVNIDGPIPKIAAKNGKIVFSVVGNYSRPITIYARYQGNVVGQATAPRAPQQLVVPINDNTSGVSRELDFSWVRSSDGKTYTIGKITQLGQ